MIGRLKTRIIDWNDQNGALSIRNGVNFVMFELRRNLNDRDIICDILNNISEIELHLFKLLCLENACTRETVKNNLKYLKII